MNAWILKQILAAAVSAFLLFCVVVETMHLVDWAAELSDGSAASYLRWHAYVYFDRIFGNPFGWSA